MTKNRPAALFVKVEVVQLKKVACYLPVNNMEEAEQIKEAARKQKYSQFDKGLINFTNDDGTEVISKQAIDINNGQVISEELGFNVIVS